MQENFTRFTVDLVIIDGLRGAIIGRIPRCDADDILCLRKVVDMICTGVGMSCDNELFFNFIVIAFAIGAASMVLFARLAGHRRDRCAVCRDGLYAALLHYDAGHPAAEHS